MTSSDETKPDYNAWQNARERALSEKLNAIKILPWRDSRNGGTPEYREHQRIANLPENVAAWGEQCEAYYRVELEETEARSGFGVATDTQETKPKVSDKPPKCEDCTSTRKGGTFEPVKDKADSVKRLRRVIARRDWLRAGRKLVAKKYRYAKRTSWGEAEAKKHKDELLHFDNELKNTTARYTLIERKTALLLKEGISKN